MSTLNTYKYVQCPRCKRVLLIGTIHKCSIDYVMIAQFRGFIKKVIDLWKSIKEKL